MACTPEDEGVVRRRRTVQEIKELEGPREDVVNDDSDSSRVTVSLEPFEIRANEKEGNSAM